MKDFPVFTTEYGVASLVLREIPYQKTAYITLQATQMPRELLAECLSFCRVCGAEHVYAAGHSYVEQFPLHTAILEYAADKSSLEPADAALWPVQTHTAEKWQTLYNQKITHVPNCAWMTNGDVADMLRDGSGYFVHRGEALLGIGKVSGEEIQWLASVMPGAGETVVRTLASAVQGDRVALTVASENKKAVALYERLGFLPVKQLRRWYKIL